MKLYLAITLLGATLHPAPGQMLAPGRYTQLFDSHRRALMMNVSTNGAIDVAWLHVNTLTGAVIGRGTFYGQATNKPNGRIVGRFPGHGLLRGRVRNNELTGTVWFHVDGQHGYARRLHLLPD